MFRWVCFGTACGFALVVLWLLFDLRRSVVSSLESAQGAVEQANASIHTVNEQLPGIVAEVKSGTSTLAGLASDVELLKSVAGACEGEPGKGLRGLAEYAEKLQELIGTHAGEREAVILIEEIVGKDLKVVETVDEFLVGLSREMIAIILPTAKSKQEVLYRVCHSGVRRKPFYVRVGSGEPERLDSFLKWHDTESADLPGYPPE